MKVPAIISWPQNLTLIMQAPFKYLTTEIYIILQPNKS